MTSHIFFRYLWKFNAVAIAGVCFLVMFVGAFAAYQIAKDVARSRSVVNVSRAATGGGDRAKLSLGSFSWLEKGRRLWAAVQAKQNYSYGLRYKSAHSVRNYVIYDVAAGGSRRLLPDNEGVVVSVLALRNGEAVHNAKVPVRAIVAAVINTDRNGDGHLTVKDGVALGVAQGDGQGLVNLPGTFTRFHTAKVVDDDTAVIIAERKGETVAFHIGLAADFPVLRSEVLVTGLGAAKKGGGARS